MVPEHNPEQYLADLEAGLLSAKRAVAEARNALRLGRARVRLSLRIDSGLAPRGEKDSPSDISAKVEVAMQEEPLKTLSRQLEAAIISLDAHRVTYHKAKNLYWAARAP